MNDLPDQEAAEIDSTGRVVETTDPDLPDFAPRRVLTTMPIPTGSAVGFDYEGDHDTLLSPADREATVRAAMAREGR